MTIAMALYTLMISLWLMLAAAVAEWVLERLRLPSRWAWVAALGLILLLPALPAIPGSIRDLTLGSPVEVATTFDRTESPAASSPVWMGYTAPASMQQALSIAVGAFFLTAWLLLAARSRRWRGATMDGTAVLLTDGAGPAVIGFLRPRIVVPGWAFELSIEQRRMLLDHEQSHIDARDPLLVLLAGVGVVLAPWNPLLWYGLRRLRGAIEIDCDRRVLAAGTGRENYAQCLLESVTRAMRRSVTPVGSLAWSSSFLERRIQVMMRPIRMSKSLALIGGVATIGLVALAGSTRPPAAPTATTAPQSSVAVPLREMTATAGWKYYGRLAHGEVGGPQLFYSLFTPDFRVRDQSEQEGC